VGSPLRVDQTRELRNPDKKPWASTGRAVGPAHDIRCRERRKTDFPADRYARPQHESLPLSMCSIRRSHTHSNMAPIVMKSPN